MTYEAIHDTLDAALEYVLDSANSHDMIECDDAYGAPFVTTASSQPGDVLMVDDDGNLENVPAEWLDRSWILCPSEFFEPHHLRHHFSEIGAFERGEFSALVIDWRMVEAYPDESEGETWDDDLMVGHVYGIVAYK